MTANRLVIVAVTLVALLAIADALRTGSDATPRATRDGYRIDLASSREGTYLSPDVLRAAFPGEPPPSIAVSKVAEAPDDIVAVAVSHVTGDPPGVAAIELWDGEERVRAFPVPAGSFSRGLWFAGEGRLIATIGWNGRGYLYDRWGRRVRGSAYFAYETG
jgi:hypothetical protein